MGFSWNNGKRERDVLGTNLGVAKYIHFNWWDGGGVVMAPIRSAGDEGHTRGSVWGSGGVQIRELMTH